MSVPETQPDGLLMKALNKKNTNKLSWIVVSLLWLPIQNASAETDKEIQEKALIAREQMRQGSTVDHSGHLTPPDPSSKFRGVFYGYLPCHEPECNGVKMTMSLNAKNKYLLVIQPAKALNRESFEKGKYEWDEGQSLLTLKPYNGDPERRLAIKDDATLLYLSNDGAHMSGDQERYMLKKTEVAGNREMHIH